MAAQLGTSHSQHAAAWRPWPQLHPVSPPVPTAPVSKQSSRTQTNNSGTLESLCTARSKLLLLLQPQEMALRVEAAASSPTECSQASSQLGAAAQRGEEGEADSRKGCSSARCLRCGFLLHTHTWDGTATRPGRQEVQDAAGQPVSSHCTLLLRCFWGLFNYFLFPSEPREADGTQQNNGWEGGNKRTEQNNAVTTHIPTRHRASPRNWPKESLFRATTAPVTTCRPWERGQENPKAAAALSNPEAEPNPRCAGSRRWPPTAGFWVSGGARRAPSPRGAPQTRGLGAQRGAALRPRCHPSCACRRRARRRRSLGKEHRGYSLISTLRTDLRGPTAISVSH